MARAEHVAEHSWPLAVDLLFDLVACELFRVVDEQTDDLCVVVAFVPHLSARSWSRPTCFAIARSLVRPMPKLVSPPVRSPISFQFASPRASRFSLSRSRTSIFVMGRAYCRLILGSERRGNGRGRWPARKNTSHVGNRPYCVPCGDVVAGRGRAVGLASCVVRWLKKGKPMPAWCCCRPALVDLRGCVVGEPDGLHVADDPDDLPLIVPSRVTRKRAVRFALEDGAASAANDYFDLPVDQVRMHDAWRGSGTMPAVRIAG